MRWPMLPSISCWNGVTHCPNWEDAAGPFCLLPCWDRLQDLSICILRTGRGLPSSCSCVSWVLACLALSSRKERGNGRYLLGQAFLSFTSSTWSLDLRCL